MDNFSLNKGGILGGIIGVLLIISVIAGIAYLQDRPPTSVPGLLILGVVVGARIGNSLWFKHFGEPTSDIEDISGRNKKKKKSGNPYLDVYVDD